MCEKSLSPPVNRPVASFDIIDKDFYTTNHQSETGGIACMEIRLKDCRILIGNGISKKIKHILEKDNFIIVTNPAVDKLFSLDQGAEKILIPDSEDSKSMRILETIYDRMIALGVSRDFAVVAFGGGVVGDVAGFAAATYMRGIDLVHVPTTLLAQVDSSIGGKTGINHKGVKNIIGSFYQPRMVLIDPAFLKTLPKREFMSGMAEVIKYGLIQDRKLFELVENNVEKITKRDGKLLETIISRCCSIKSRIVAEDEKERGKRMLLNFGHTIGHALESSSRYRLKHGEAVALGMIAAAGVSDIPGEEKERIKAVLQKLGLPTKMSGGKDITGFIKLDKKARKGRNKFVFLASIGKSYVGEAGNGTITKAIQAIK